MKASQEIIAANKENCNSLQQPVWEASEHFIFQSLCGFNPPEKYESQIGSSSQLLGKIKNVPVTTNQLCFGRRKNGIS